jgi:hypothetical protein
MKIWVLMLTVLLLSSCSTLEDFQKMTPEQRANKVCDYEASSYTYRINSINSEINSLRGLLMDGFKVVKRCRTTAYHNKKGIKVTKSTCVDTIVPLTKYALLAYEDKIESLKGTVLLLNNKKSITYLNCIEEVGGLDANQAYQRY